MLEEFGRVIVAGGSGVVIASQSGHRLQALTPEEDRALATTPVEQLLALPMLQPDVVTDPLNAYQLSKRGNVLRVLAQAVAWGRRGARVNAISPGIIVTPLARDELTGPRAEGYRAMLTGSPTGRAGTADEVATVAALLMGPDGALITGSDVLMARWRDGVLVLRRPGAALTLSSARAEPPVLHREHMKPFNQPQADTLRRGSSGRFLQAIEGSEVALGHEALSGSAGPAAELGEC